LTIKIVPISTRYGGVLEAVRVARSGFPVRLSHSDFYSRYRGLANPFNKDTKSLPLSLENPSLAEKYCQSLLVTLWDEETGQRAIIVGDSREAEEKRAKQSRSVSAWLRVTTGAKNSTTVTSKDSIQCGLTKVFLRKPAHDMLEGRRSRRMRAAAVMIQSGNSGYGCSPFVSLFCMSFHYLLSSLSFIVLLSVLNYLDHQTTLTIKIIPILTRV
jgi:myosin heavy subunit